MRSIVKCGAGVGVTRAEREDGCGDAEGRRGRAVSTYDCKHQAEGERDCLKEWAEGWAFAAAALPQIAKCDADAAEVVRKNLEVPPAGGKAGDQVPDGYMKVKEAVEGTYECLGITCEQVGVFDAENSGMEVCTGGGSSDAALGLRASLLAALAALAAYAL